MISDNHIGDWGTQFGMIIYGYKHFRDEEAYEANPVVELGRLYRLVNRLVDYHDAKAALPGLREQLERQSVEVESQRAAAASAGKPADKSAAKALRRGEANLAEARAALAARGEHRRNRARFGTIQVGRRASRHRARVLAETAKLHPGDPENLRLWREFMPCCLDEIDRIYRRLGVTFDHTLGESFYHDRLAGVVEELLEARHRPLERGGRVRVSRRPRGADHHPETGRRVPVRHHRPGHDPLPHGEWPPDAILYVVDHRQSLHFEQLFAAARLLGYATSSLQHVSFRHRAGRRRPPVQNPLGRHGGPGGLLDEAVRRAHAIVSADDDAKPGGAEISPASAPANRRGGRHRGLEVRRPPQNRTSDYVFSYDKMLAMNGNTATYMQYAYARVRSIFAKGEVDVGALRRQRRERRTGASGRTGPGAGGCCSSPRPWT